MAFTCLHATEPEKQNPVRQVIVHSGGCTENCMKLQIMLGIKVKKPGPNKVKGILVLYEAEEQYK